MPNDIIDGQEVASSIPWTSQPYKATHDGEGNRLSHLRRSFISFSYGGRNIEDFDLISTTSSDRIQRNFYATFNDIVSDYEILDGQRYWGTAFAPNSIAFVLATDGVSEAQLQDFRHWFKPGIEKELILSENPNRAILARVASAPILSMLPFELPITKEINGVTYTTSTTRWKGEIQLEFIMDDPFWYAVDSVLTDLTPDNLKVYIEDGIPTQSMIQTDCFLSNNSYYADGAFTHPEFFDEDGVIITSGISLEDNNTLYLYNCGTAPAKPTLSFVFTPIFDNNSDFISYPNNKYAKNGLSTINIGSDSFSFTTPSILTAYNQAIEILNKFNAGDSMVELKKALRNGINEYYVRGRAAAICNAMLYGGENPYVDSNSALQEGFYDKFVELLQQGFIDENGITKPIFCSFNSIDGTAILKTEFNAAEDKIDAEQSSPSIEELEESYTFIKIEENVGDMVRSKYLLIEDRTLPSENDIIISSGCIPITTENCVISNFGLDYKYLYL